MNAATSTTPPRSRLHELTVVDRKLLRKVRRIITLFRALEPRMPSSYMDAFMLVALKPGEGPTEYAKDLGTQQPIASRILLELGSHARERDHQLGLIDRQISPTSLAKQEYFLTPKGIRLMSQILETMKDD